MRRLFALIILLATAPVLSAQIIPGGGRSGRPNVQRRVPGDTSRTDSARADTASRELIKWEQPDSIETELLNRAGYSATRYQGRKVNFDAKNRILYLEGSPATGRAAVGRSGTILVGDTITYNDSTKIVVALGDTLMLRDPSRGSSDVVALGRMTYNVEQRRGTVTNISTSIESGEKWFVQGAVAAFRNDTTGGKSTAFYARNGIITSCDDSVPDYHFAAREIKMISRNIMVARPAILYIGDVPVFYLPFIFQDMRSGRRSGILTPRFGVGEIFRNSPSYRRHVDNLGYYFAINDYMDGELSLDWRSGAAATSGDPGWVRLNGEWRYRWLDRFLTGRLGVSRLSQRDGSRNTAISWGHQQEFSQTTRLTTDINFVTSTTLQRQNTFDPRQALATIQSHVSYAQQFGPASMSIGGSRTQYPGRKDVSQDFPNFSISAPTIPIASWLEWTPSLTVNNAQQFKVDRNGEFAYQVRNIAGVLDTTRRLTADSRLTNLSFTTPLKIFGFSLSNTITANDQENNQPVRIPVINQNNPSEVANRVFARTYSTQLDWNTSFGLPALMQSTLKLAPSISFQNVDGHAFWVRTEQTGGRYVHQTKRPSYSLGASPTVFGLFPGIGGIGRFRHSVSPTISYSYSPAATVGKDYLAALNIDPRGYLGNLASNQVSLNLSQVLEAKMKTRDTSSTAEPRKIKLLAIGMSPLSYDFERKRKTGHSGFTNDAFNYNLNSDLLPGFTFDVGYSLFQGNPLSDSSKFKPFRTSISSSFSFNGSSGIFGAISRVFGKAIPNTSPQTEKLGQSGDDALSQRVASTPVAGSANRNNLYAVPSTQSWQASFTFTSQRQRPPTGNGTIIEQDPRALCQGLLSNPLSYDLCIQQQSINPTSAAPIGSITAGTPFIRVPSRENLGSNMSFHLTPKWSGTWNTNYDFQTKRFASHSVTLQRELHDWRTIFAFTRTPTGNFSFNFFVALNAQPDIKFNYDKQTYRQSDQ